MMISCSRKIIEVIFFKGFGKLKYTLSLTFKIHYVKMTPDEIRKAIGEIPQSKPNEAEGLIRELNVQISNLKEASEKEKLFHKLRAVAYLELHVDLKKGDGAKRATPRSNLSCGEIPNECSRTCRIPGRKFQ